MNPAPDDWLGGESMAAMWKCGADEGLAICLLMDPRFLPSVDAMCQKVPKTPVVVDHFARIGIDGQIHHEDLDNLCGLARHKSVRVKVSAYYALGKKKAAYLDLAPMIRRLLDAFGPDRLMWASDSPFQILEGHRYQDSIDLFRTRVDFLAQPIAIGCCAAPRKRRSSHDYYQDADPSRCSYRRGFTSCSEAVKSRSSRSASA